jgi:hypothetical protein
MVLYTFSCRPREALQAVYSLEPNDALRNPVLEGASLSPDITLAASNIPDPELASLFAEVQQVSKAACVVRPCTSLIIETM